MIKNIIILWHLCFFCPNILLGQYTVDFKIYGKKFEVQLTDKINSGYKAITSNCEGIKYFSKYMEVYLAHEELIPQFDNIVTELELNTYGYLLLIDSFVDKVFSEKSKEDKKLLKWYLLVKSGFDSIVTCSEAGFNIYCRFDEDFFYLKNVVLPEKKLRYYSIDMIDNHVESYQVERFCDDETSTSSRMVITIPNKDIIKEVFAIDIISVKHTFDYQGTTFDLDIQLNKNALTFFRELPLLRKITYYIAGSDVFRKSIHDNFDSLLNDKSFREQIDILLAFCQSFDYAEDADIFGKEKYFFPEQTLFYNKSDCDDRVILFALMLKELLNIKSAIALKTNERIDHLFIGIELDKEQVNLFNERDYFLHEGKVYLFCEPTGVNYKSGGRYPELFDSELSIIPIF